jgi:hypothetical protein
MSVSKNSTDAYNFSDLVKKCQTMEEKSGPVGWNEIKAL